MVISRPTSHLLRLSLLVASFATAADGHGAVTVPPSRNAVDRTLEPWRGPVPTPVPVLPFEPWCPLPSSSRGAVDGRNISGANGQACFFFSNGCTPGCAACDGVTRGPLPNFTATPPQGKREVSVGCTTPAQPTNCDPRTRSVNTGTATFSQTVYRAASSSINTPHAPRAVPAGVPSLECDIGNRL